MPAAAVAVAGYALRNPRRTGRWVAIALILLGLWYLLLISIYGSIFGLRPLQGGYGPSRLATAEIPSQYLQLYQQAGERYGIDPWILAAIGAIETSHGTSTQAGVRSGVNFAGCCAGPMQFSIVGSPSTWDSYGVDGNHDGTKSPYDPEDAIPAAARYLRASGAPADYHRAIFAYNHAEWYVAEVLAKAAAYRGAARAGATTAEPFLNVGDSLAVGTAGPLATLRPTVTTEAATGRTSTQGLAELRSATSLPATLLVQLGTNDTSVREFRANVRAIKRLPGVQDIYWVNIARPPLGGTTDTELNAVLEAEAGPHFHIIDWKAEITSGRAELAPDHIHATADGYKARARLIDQSLPLVGGAGDITAAGVTEILHNPPITLTTGQRADIAHPGIASCPPSTGLANATPSSSPRSATTTTPAPTTRPAGPRTSAPSTARSAAAPPPAAARRSSTSSPPSPAPTAPPSSSTAGTQTPRTPTCSPAPTTATIHVDWDA